MLTAWVTMNRKMLVYRMPVVPRASPKLGLGRGREERKTWTEERRVGDGMGLCEAGGWQSAPSTKGRQPRESLVTDTGRGSPKRKREMMAYWS